MLRERERERETDRQTDRQRDHSKQSRILIKKCHVSFYTHINKIYINVMQVINMNLK